MFPGLDIIFLSRRGPVFLLVYITIREIVIQNLLCPRYVFGQNWILFFFFFFFFFFFLILQPPPPLPNNKNQMVVSLRK